MSRAPSRSATGAASASNSPNEAGSSTLTASSGTTSSSGHSSDFPVTSTSPPRVERISSRSARYSTAKSTASATPHSTLTATHSTPSVATSRSRSPSPTKRTDRTTTSGEVCATTFPSTFNASSNTLFLIFIFTTSMRLKPISPAGPQRPTGLITHSGRLLQPAITKVIYR